MKVSYKPADSTGDYVALFDTSVALSEDMAGPAILQEFSPDYSPTTQERALAFSKSSFRAPRGNISTSFTLKFNISYNGYGQCFDANAAMNTALVDILLHVKVEQEGSATPQYYPNATCTRLAYYNGGTAADFTVQFKSDNVTTTAP